MLKYDITFCASKTCTKIANCDRHYSNTNFPPNSIVSMADFSEGVEKFPCKDFLKPETSQVTLPTAKAGGFLHLAKTITPYW